MYVYILLREYHNNVAVVDNVFSSKKKAAAHLEWLKQSAIRDGWTVEEGPTIYRWFAEGKVRGTRIIPSAGLPQADTYYILKEKVV